MSVITIARGTLSGGQATAERVAARLGYPCLGREELIERASRFGVPGPRLAQILETTPNLWERLSESREAYIAYLQAAMADLAEAGNLVYHGQLGQELLKGVRPLVKVRVIAPMEYRITAAMAAQRLDRQAAIEYIQRADEDRLKRTRFFFGVDWRDPSLYDLVINLDQMSEDTAAELIVTLPHSSPWGTPQGELELERHLRDFVVASRVRVALMVNGWAVRVQARDGLVKLSGEVQLLPSEELDDVMSLAASVPGVREVNLDEVRPRILPFLPL
jgi:cytidylate kinase